VLARAPGLRFNEHLDEEDGPLVFEHLHRGANRTCRFGGIRLSDWLGTQREGPRHAFETEHPFSIGKAGERNRRAPRSFILCRRARKSRTRMMKTFFWRMLGS